MSGFPPPIHRTVDQDSVYEYAYLTQSRQDIVAWVGSHVLPHEASVRAWLRRWMRREQDVDDVIQEAYCRLAMLDSIAHIGNGRAYLFQTARNIVLEQVRRSKIVRIDNLTDATHLHMVDEAPLPDRVLAGARELARVERLINELPTKCRRVFILRRIHGESQRDIARKFGISESAVEKQAMRGLKMILRAMEREDKEEPLAGDIDETARERAHRR